MKSGTTLKIYVNRTEENSCTQTNDTPDCNSTYALHIGAGSSNYVPLWWHEHSDGMVIDELTVWTKALSAQEVTDMQIKAVDPKATNLGAYYKFDDPRDGLFIRDYSGNGNHGTAHQDDHKREVSGSSVP